jgi:hypothetical protein
MIRRLLLAGLLASAACGGAEKKKPAAPRLLTPAEIAKRTIPSVVTIRTDRGSRGTGFVIGSEGLIATNLHVVTGASRVAITVADGRVFDQVTVAGFDPRHDLVVLRIKARSLPVLRLSEVEPELGQPVVVIGHPRGFENTLSDGLVSAVRQLRPGLEVIQISAPISQGSSGGPVLDQRGRVIGVAYLTSMVGQNLNFAVPARYLAALADERGDAPITTLPDDSARQVFAGCSSDELATIHIAIHQARRTGRALSKKRRHREALDHYRLATTSLLLRIPRCRVVRRMLLRGAARAEYRRDKPAEATFELDLILREVHVQLITALR